jgi:hypothetical protein
VSEYFHPVDRRPETIFRCKKIRVTEFQGMWTQDPCRPRLAVKRFGGGAAILNLGKFVLFFPKFRMMLNFVLSSMANGRFLPQILSQVTSGTKQQPPRAFISLRACEINLSVRPPVCQHKKKLKTR